MAYTKTNWQNSPSTNTPINADNLNHIEQGIYDADAKIDNILDGYDMTPYYKDFISSGELCKFYPTGTHYRIYGTYTNVVITAYEFYDDGTYTAIDIQTGGGHYSFDYVKSSEHVSYLRIYAGYTGTSPEIGNASALICNVEYPHPFGILTQQFLSPYTEFNYVSVNTIENFPYSDVKELPVNKIYTFSNTITDELFSNLPIYGTIGTLISFSSRLSYGDRRCTAYLYLTHDKKHYIAYADTNATLNWIRIDNTDVNNAFPDIGFESKTLTANGELFKLYPETGVEYDLFLMGTNISSCSLYEFDENSNYTEILNVSGKTLPVKFHYKPASNTTYLRFYGRIIEGQTAKIGAYYIKAPNLLSSFLNKSDDLATDMMLSKEFAIVKKFTVMGDSMSSGYYKESSSGTAYGRNIQYSWPQIMGRIYGQSVVNATESGATTASWWTDEHGYCKANVTNSTKSQVYIMALGTNDYKNIPDDEITDAQIGSASDINTSDYTQNADSFWGNYCKILQYVHDVAPDAKIICCTIPAPRPNTTWKQEAIRQICAYSLFADYVVLCDLEKDYADLSNSKAMLTEMWQSHFTPAGYANSAEFLMYAFSKTIQKNLTMFINIPQIPYDLPVTEDYIKSLLTTYAETAVDIISTNTDNIVVNGKYVELDGVVYFSMILYYTNSINTGRNNIFTNFPAPDNTKVTFFELGESAEYLNTYLSYTSAWRINGAHLVGQVRRVFGKYQKSQQTQ